MSTGAAQLTGASGFTAAERRESANPLTFMMKDTLMNVFDELKCLADSEYKK